MKHLNLPAGEAIRLAALRQYEVLDTLPEQALDDLAALAARICEAPVAMISLVDEQRVWFKSKVGMEISETPRETSFCTHAMRQSDLFTVQDARLDPRFAANPLVTGDPGIRFYAGAALVSHNGHGLGTLCVIDRIPRTLSPSQEQSMRVLARQVMTHLELRRHTLSLAQSEERSRSIVESALDAIVTIDHENKIVGFNAAAERMFHRDLSDVLTSDITSIIFADHLADTHFDSLKSGRSPLLGRHVELYALRADGTKFPVEMTAAQLGGTLPPRFTIFLRDITLRRKVEHALQSSEAELTRAQRLAHIGSWEHTLATGDLHWSEETYRIFGRSSSDSKVTYASFLAAVHPEDKVHFLEAHERLLRDEGGLDLEHRIYRPDGTTRWVHELGEVQKDDLGQPSRFFGTVMDITDRHLADEERRISEERYRTLFEYAPDGIVIANRESYYTDANASICRMLGYTREELTGMHASDIVSQSELKHIEPALATITSKNAYQREWQFRRKDGSAFDAEVIATAMPDGNLLGMIRDITERKQNESRFRRLMESNVQGVIFWNAKGGIKEANDAFLNFVGYTRENLESGALKWDSLTPAEFAHLDQQALEAIAITGICPPYEKEFIRKDGSRVPVLVGSAAFEDNPDEGVCFVLDLTERRKLEQQFLRAQRMESIGTLAGGIAHDLNNVLAPIIMALELLSSRFPDRASQDLISIISSSANRGADMVRQVLSFARGVGGNKVEVPIKHLLLDMEKIVNDTFLKNIQVRTIIPKDLWTVVGDPTQLHQVLLNLCVNARDSMPNGGTLVLSAENLVLDSHYAGLNIEANPGPYVFLQVEDSGTGIPAEVIEKIFDPFFTTKELGKGTGLGLSTSLAIVKSHDGFLRVYSEEGRGTKFKVYLPAQVIRTEAAAAAAADMPRGHGELILVVDDEKSVREITKQTLEAFGYRAILAADGTEAVALYATRGNEIAVVLTDMMMPIMDGPTTIQVLRKMDPKWSLLPQADFQPMDMSPMRPASE